MQIWPALAKAPNTAALTASSISASSSTISGALPPSSSRTGFRCSAQSLAIVLPTLVEPVKFTRLTAGCAISAATTFAASAGALEITLTTPFGKPASFMIWPIRRWVAGQTSDDLRTTVLPQARGVAIARTPRITGAFHGAMPRTTPAGCRTASEITPGLSAGMISPAIWVVRPAASRSMLAAKWTLKPAQGAVAPISSIMGWVNSPARASSKSAALSRSARRSPGPVCDQAGNARAAASTTLAASASLAAAASLATAPVTGSWRAYVAPEAAEAAAPSMMKSTFILTSLCF